MHLKRFRAATMDEALRRIGEELGPEAVILHTKSVPLAGAGPLARTVLGSDISTREKRPDCRSSVLYFSISVCLKHLPSFHGISFRK